IVPGDAQAAMYMVGVIEILAGVVVAVAPRFGGWLVAGWLAGIIVNLLTIPDHYDVALRDFGLLLGAVALARLAQRYHGTQERGTAGTRVGRGRVMPGAPPARVRTREAAGPPAGSDRPAPAAAHPPSASRRASRPRRPRTWGRLTWAPDSSSFIRAKSSRRGASSIITTSSRPSSTRASGAIRRPEP